MQTVDERDMPASQVSTQSVAQSDGPVRPMSSPGQDAPQDVDQYTAAKELVLVNTSVSAGPVRFLVGDILYELLPGETERVESGPRWHVQFHRGGGFGAADYTLSAGRYEFQVTDFGWQLTKVAGTAEIN